jgi:pSer/pThr/pTyr-binding forkhead associated (FHA) protein
MRAQLIVVQGKLEGKKIPLVGPVFRIGRGETCHLRPNSAQVSREHAEFTITPEGVTVRDLGSRNGTLVNGKALTRPQMLKDRDVVQVGPLAFQVAFAGAQEPVAAATGDTGVQAAIPHLPDDLASLIPLESTGIHGGDTVLIAAFKEPQSSRGADISDDEGDDQYERLPVDDGSTEEMPVGRSESDKGGKKDGPTSRTDSKQSRGGAANILRKLMERRKASN